MRPSSILGQRRFGSSRHVHAKWQWLIPFACLWTACVEPPKGAELSSDSVQGTQIEAGLKLTCSVNVIPKRRSNSPSQVQVTLVNTGASSAAFVARDLPFAHPEREYFAVDHAGKPVDFRGLRAKLLAPTQADLVRLEPGAALEAIYTLSTYYHLNEVGAYDLRMMRPSVHVFRAGGLQKIGLDCNGVTIQLAEPEPEPDPIIASKQQVATSSFIDCDPAQQATVLRAQAVARWMVPIALGTKANGRTQVAPDSRYYQDWFGLHTTPRATVVGARVAKIGADLLDEVDYKCHSDQDHFCDGAIAWTVPVLGNKVHLCEPYFGQPDVGWDTKWGVLIHELSHLGLTADFEYGRPDSLDLADNSPALAIHNADNYEYFVEDIYLGLAPRNDVNGDGHSDLVTTAFGSGFVYPGTSSATFGPYAPSFAGTMNTALFDHSGHWLLDAADMNLDGYDDLVTIGSDGILYVYFGSASGTFSTGAVSSNFDGGQNLNLVFDDGIGYEPLGVADTNGDLNLDLITIRNDGALCWFAGSSSGHLTSAKTCSVVLDSAFMDGVGEHVIDLADVNGDGRADVITASTWGTVVVYPGGSNGGFGPGIGSFAGTYDLALYDGTGHEPISVADVTGDGRADLVTHYHVNNSTYVYPGLPDATFGAGVASFAGTMDSSIFDQTGHELIGVFDVDGNGLADLVTRHTNGNAYVYPGLSTGQFGSSVASFAGTLNSSRFDNVGHEFITERRQHRRRGCTPTGCL